MRGGGAAPRSASGGAAAEAKPKRRRRKSQNRGKNSAGARGDAATPAGALERVQQQAYPNAMLGYSNDSMIYMDEGTDTDKYHISSKKSMKAMTLQKSGETEL